MNTIDTLLAYGEWLDGEGLANSPKDDRSWEDLAKEFVEQWEARPGTAVLAGREPVAGQAAADLSADALGLSPVVDPVDDQNLL